ncbi:unnamed protein product [Miscanthus lutarioriparius]|uniref:Uncharacterized protein n=1 Tax=Miscanthus lutarioriparius TaxID=422564 RepID=A0A811PT60_9POAL|nr:unnamed protein product [Miscanthus lutarioriparius]
MGLQTQSLSALSCFAVARRSHDEEAVPRGHDVGGVEQPVVGERAQRKGRLAMEAEEVSRHASRSPRDEARPRGGVLVVKGAEGEEAEESDRQPPWCAAEEGGIAGHKVAPTPGACRWRLCGRGRQGWGCSRRWRGGLRQSAAPRRRQRWPGAAAWRVALAGARRMDMDIKPLLLLRSVAPAIEEGGAIANLLNDQSSPRGAQTTRSDISR